MEQELNCQPFSVSVCLSVWSLVPHPVKNCFKTKLFLFLFAVIFFSISHPNDLQTCVTAAETFSVLFCFVFLLPALLFALAVIDNYLCPSVLLHHSAAARLLSSYVRSIAR